MRSRSMRAPIAILAILGLLAAMTAVPAAAQSSTPDCEAIGQSTGEVADGVTLSYDSSFACTDAADSGTWAITVEVTNGADSTSGIELTDVTLALTSPRPGGVGPEGSIATHTLPLALSTDANGAFDVEGAYELASVDGGDRVTLHLRVAGVTGDDEPFVLGVNVQVLGPGLEPDVDENGENEENGDGAAGQGRPEWVPGPPPWVVELLRSIFVNGFPWGTDDFPPGRAIADEAKDAEAAGNGEEAGPPEWAPGPPPWAPAPPAAEPGGSGENGSGTDDVVAPPDFVRPGGPPAGVPAGPSGAGGRP